MAQAEESTAYTHIHDTALDTNYDLVGVVRVRGEVSAEKMQRVVFRSAVEVGAVPEVDASCDCGLEQGEGIRRECLPQVR